MSKLIVITGASSGFGAEIAKKLHQQGHNLLLLARRVEQLKSLNLKNSICRQVDVTDYDAFKEAVTYAESVYGDVDCLINNAGLMLLGSVLDQSPSEWQQMLNTNVSGLLNGMQAVLQTMKARKHGTIINISSVAGTKTYEHHAVYCGTKFAVHGISDSVRWEMAPFNVRVITISPGAAETQLLQHTTSSAIVDDYQSWKESIGGVMSASDVADTVLFAYNMPQHVCIRDLVVTPTKQQN